MFWLYASDYLVLEVDFSLHMGVEDYDNCVPSLSMENIRLEKLAVTQSTVFDGTEFYYHICKESLVDSLHRTRGYVVLGGSKNCTGVCIVLYCTVLYSIHRRSFVRHNFCVSCLLVEVTQGILGVSLSNRCSSNLVCAAVKQNMSLIMSVATFIFNSRRSCVHVSSSHN
jgi:hypothetical protein